MTAVLKQKIFVLFVLAVLLLTLVGFLLLNQSLAWFSKNGEVTADGFSLQTSVSSNLIIGKTPDELTAENYHFSVGFTEVESGNLIAVTHSDSAEDTFLAYLFNNYDINYETGLLEEGAELNLVSVPLDEREKYYIDFEVYIASAFEELYVSSLTATIDIPEAVDVNQYPYFYAASVDFYVGSVSVENFVETLSVAESLDGGSVEFSGKIADGRVPLNTDGYVKIIMRCYFDGALTDDNGRAYINSKTVGTDRIALGVAFTAVDAVAEDEAE